MIPDKSTILAHFNKNDLKLVEYISRIDFNEWFSSKPKNNQEMFMALCRIIVGQQLSGKAARSIFEKFKKYFGTRKITPQAVLKHTEAQLRETGISWAKARYIKALAQNFADNSLDFGKLERLDDEAVVSELVKIKGIGRWSAEMFLMFSLHRLDVFSHGDLGLNKAITKIYKLRKPTKKRIEKIIKNWSPYKTFGSVGLWVSLDNS